MYYLLANFTTALGGCNYLYHFPHFFNEEVDVLWTLRKLLRLPRILWLPDWLPVRDLNHTTLHHSESWRWTVLRPDGLSWAQPSTA